MKGITIAMNNMNRTHIFLLFCAIIIDASASVDTLFPTPAILKENVAFWKKVYTEWPTTMGVIHDRDYPNVIYDTIKGNVESSEVKKRKELIINQLKNIYANPESTWTSKEKNIALAIRKFTPIDSFGSAVDRVRFQLGQADRYREGLIRSGLYIDTIRAILREKGVPERLAYLPHVESSFNTEAYSKVGAAGLWQFMRSTGKMYGMKIDYTVDERRDPIIATQCAAQYLSSAYKDLQSWPLAITSYNHGVNGMKRAVKQTGSRDLAYIIQNYESRSFKFASSNFYSCFIAASEIAMNYKTYFPTLSLSPRLHFIDFTLTHYIKPEILCKSFNMTIDQLAMLNPAIREIVYDQHKKLPKGFVIHVPASLTSELALAAIASIPDSLKSLIPDRPHYYKVVKGDNLLAIANRLGVTVNDLMSENDLTKKSAIRSGQLLRVPASQSRVTSTAVASKTTSDTEKATAKPVTLASVPPQTTDKKTPEPKKESAIIIAQNNMAKTIPEKESIDTQPIKKSEPAVSKVVINEIPKSQAQPVTSIPKSQSVETINDSLKEIAVKPAIEETSPLKSEKPPVNGIFDILIYNLDIERVSSKGAARIKVSIDETIGHYAEWLNIPTSQIRRLNNMGRTSDIQFNKALLLPVTSEDVLNQFEASRLEYHMAIEEDFYTQYKVTELKSYTIKNGETLWDICNQADIENALPLWLFKKYNKHIDINKLHPLMQVWLPVIAEKGSDDIGIQEVKLPDYSLPFVSPLRKEPTETQRTK
jgi:membrane-bound lytic murein transglycosylase D